MMKCKLLSRTALVGTALSMVVATGAMAAPRFPNVPADHWAAEHINELADGDLIHGYDTGNFGPDDVITIEQLATIIANQRLVEVEGKGDIWAYSALEFCSSLGMDCIPESFWFQEEDPIMTGQFSAPCTRELAVYMLSHGLGFVKRENVGAIDTSAKIPDWNKIDSFYQPAVLAAYKYDILTGVAADGSFNPKGEITRAEICTLLNRMNITEAFEAPIPEANPASTSKEVFDELASWTDEFELKENNSLGVSTLTSINHIHGNIQITYKHDIELISIRAKEAEKHDWVADGVSVDKFGNPLVNYQYMDENGVLITASAWSYEGRQFLKEILKVAFPTGYEEAYLAMVGTLRQDLYEAPGDNLPSALRWIDGKLFEAGLDNRSHAMFLDVGDANDAELYSLALQYGSIGGYNKYDPIICSDDELITAFELDKW